MKQLLINTNIDYTLLKEILPENIVRYNKGVNVKDFDLIFTDDVMEYSKIYKDTKNTPLVFINDKLESENYLSYWMYPNLSLIIKFTNTDVLPYCGIPDNKIFEVKIRPKDFKEIITESKYENKLLFIINDHFDFLTAIKLISIVNTSRRYNLKIITSLNIEYLKSISNQNIEIELLVKDIENYISECDILFANRNIALLGVLSEKAVIVTGQKGFGGFITPDNVISHHNSGYAGRIGGNEDEHIPLEILLHDLGKIAANFDDYKTLTSQNRTMICDYLSTDKVKIELQEKIGEIIKYYQFKNVPDNYVHLKPRLRKNTKITHVKHDSYIVSDLMCNKFLGELDNYSHDFIKYFDGNKSIDEYFIENCCSDDDKSMVLDYIKELDESGIIELCI